ncbi:MAG: hypothetical protein WBV66_15785 [Pseudolabrys sp.]
MSAFDETPTDHDRIVALRKRAMPRFGIHRREFDEQESNALQVNWRRGLMRVWVLLSAAWIMGWIVYLTIYGIQSGFQSSGDFLAILVLLISPPIALLLFGLVAGWAFRGFKPGK